MKWLNVIGGGVLVTTLMATTAVATADEVPQENQYRDHPAFRVEGGGELARMQQQNRYQNAEGERKMNQSQHQYRHQQGQMKHNGARR